MTETLDEQTLDLKQREVAVLLPSYGKFPFVISGGEGHVVWDGEGNRYLDFYGGHAVALLGHCPKPVVEALTRQAKRLLFYSAMTYSEERTRAATALVKLCGLPGGRVFFCNSGAEANENALRIARLATGRPKAACTSGSFHGRTAGALAVTGLAKYRLGLNGPAANTVTLPFGDLEAARKLIGPDVAAVIVEPILSMAGVVVPPPRYLEGLSALCRERGALLIMDEVQTGLGRVGAPTASAAFGVEPDLMTFAKALASGVPCGAVVASGPLAAQVSAGDLGSTFGGGPLACAAAAATLEAILQSRLWERAARLEGAARKRLRMPLIREIRGRGLLLGLVLDRPAFVLRNYLLQQRILTGTSDDPQVLRLMPPLTIGEAEIEALARALEAFS